MRYNDSRQRIYSAIYHSLVHLHLWNRYDVDMLMKEIAKLRKIITKRGTRNSNPVMLHYYAC